MKLVQRGSSKLEVAGSHGHLVGLLLRSFDEITLIQKPDHVYTPVIIGKLNQVP